jgi:alpha-tubulin suppressor-like RCC1 family protein
MNASERIVLALLVVSSGCGEVLLNERDASIDAAVDHDAGDVEDATATMHQLTVLRDGDGSGTVVSIPAGIDCGNQCTAGFEDGTTVTLIASADADSELQSWSGAECGQDGRCMIRIDRDVTIGASFVKRRYEVAVTIEGSGIGRVVSSPSGLDCSDRCSATFANGDVVQLSAHPDDYSRVSRWSGACSGSTSSCTLTIDGPKALLLTFEVRPQVSAGSVHTCGLHEDGAARCWGAGGAGRLGNGNSDNVGDDERPATVPEIDLGGRIAHIAAGGGHSCALLRTGEVRCWGKGGTGQLGYGNRQDNVGDDERPGSLPPLAIGGPALQVVCGEMHSCALLVGGSIRCWGSGESGQLGYGTMIAIGDDETPESTSPVDVGGLVRRLAAGTNTTCAILETGEVRCWGAGSSGMLGLGAIEIVGDDEVPSSRPPINLGGRAVQIAIGSAHVCAMLDDGAVRCWGDNTFGQLGLGRSGNVGDDESPAAVPSVDLGGRAVLIAAGGSTSCAVLEDDTLRCWGSGAAGALGLGDGANIGDDEAPASVGALFFGGTKIIDVAAGGSHTCIVLEPGSIRCWGDATYGRLGYGNLTPITIATNAPDVQY